MARKSRIDEGVTGAGNIYDFGLEDTEAPGEVEDAAEDVTVEEIDEPEVIPAGTVDEPEVIPAGAVSAQTNAEIEAGRAALAKFASNAAKE